MDWTGGVLARAHSSLAAGPGEAVYVEFLGAIGKAGPPGERESVTVVELLRASPSGEGSGCPRPAEEAEVMARGNEPFWRVDVFEDRIVFREPENIAGVEFPSGEALEEGARRVYRSTRQGAGPRDIEVALERRGCNDSMSGEYLHFTATSRWTAGSSRDALWPRTSRS